MLLTRKGQSGQRSPNRFSSSLSDTLSRALPTMDRRTFLKRSGIGVGAGIAASQLTLIQKAKAAEGAKGTGSKIEVKRTICTHCSVGCAVDAVVENGIWVRQEPVFDSPINLGAHCAKGAALREHGHGEYRLKYPMKLVNGKYQRISWDVALNEISAKLIDMKKTSGPDSVFWVGSSKHNNEQAALMRKFVSFFGSNTTNKYNNTFLSSTINRCVLRHGHSSILSNVHSSVNINFSSLFK